MQHYEGTELETRTTCPAEIIEPGQSVFMSHADDQGLGIRGWISGQKPQPKVKVRTEPEILDKHRIAVLPFSNISPDSKDEYFADGMTEELIATLSSISGLRVIARTSVMRYKVTSKGVGEIGRELKVGTILEGSVRKSENRLRATVQLIDPSNEEHLWAESYDREIQDIFAIQSDIAQRVAEALKIRLLSAQRQDIERVATENIEAYKLYLKGRYYWNERSREGNEKAVKYLMAAINLDRKYALSYVGLADCYIVSSDYAWIAPREGYQKVKEYTTKAIEIDPRLAEAHASLGWLYACHQWKWRDAETEFKRALGLKPSYATGLQWYGLFLEFVGRPGEAYDQIRRASDLDPLSRIIGLNLAYALLLINKREDAAKQCRKVIEANPGYADAYRFLGFLRYMDSRTVEALEELKKAVDFSGGDFVAKGDFATLLGLLNRRDDANEILEELENLSSVTYIPTVLIAQILFSIGRTEEAFAYLEKLDEDRSSRILYFTLWPWFETFRKDPRWVSLETRMGLVKRNQEEGW